MTNHLQMPVPYPPPPLSAVLGSLTIDLSELGLPAGILESQVGSAGELRGASRTTTNTNELTHPSHNSPLPGLLRRLSKDAEHLVPSRL